MPRILTCFSYKQFFNASSSCVGEGCRGACPSVVEGLEVAKCFNPLLLRKPVLDALETCVGRMITQDYEVCHITGIVSVCFCGV